MPLGHALSADLAEDISIGKVKEPNGICREITTVKLRSARPDEAANLMIERAGFMATEQGATSFTNPQSADPQSASSGGARQSDRSRQTRFEQLQSGAKPGRLK
ncbi:MAG TPA: hypothetical protein VGJ20_16705 [Xanthobacteraceae bacterium]